jgi:hypothetical protein
VCPRDMVERERERVRIDFCCCCVCERDTHRDRG